MKIIKKFPRKVKEIVNAEIPLKDGTKLAARIWLPADAEKSPVPAILEYLPYRKRDGTYVRDQLTHPYFAGHGYAGVRVDMRGNGDSDGIMLDEYVDKQMPTAFVFGNEVDGVSDEVIQVCDGVIEIPQWGMKHSLNISVAAAVVLWEFVRKVD